MFFILILQVVDNFVRPKNYTFDRINEIQFV